MRITALLTACVLSAACTAPALADVSAAAGAYTSTSPSATGGAVMVSTGASIPAVPVDLQATLLVPLAKNGGYAVTGEVRGFTGGGFGGAYIGGGAGFGNLSSDQTPGPLFTLFAGKKIAPFTSVEIRFIESTRSGGTTAGFLGLRFTI